MITEDLIAYIQSQAKKNFSKDEIASKLASAGWHDEDIKEALDKVVITTSVPVVPDIPIEKEETKKNFDPYRELPEIAKIDVSTPITGKDESHKLPTIKIEIPPTQMPKVWIPTVAKPLPANTTHEVLQTGKVIKPSPVVNVNPLSQTTKIEIPVIPVENKPVIKKEIPIISIKNDLELRNEEIPAPKAIPEIPKINIPPVIATMPIMDVKPVTPEVPIKTEAPIINIETKPQIKTDDNLAKIAMTSSYTQDVLSLSNVESKSFGNKSKIITKLSIIIALILIIGGTSFAFMKGYIKIPILKINLFLVKKDPKALLLNTTTFLHNLKSYKIETTATISSPLFSNISSGLISGVAVNSIDRDFILINTKGAINQNSLPLPISSYDISISGSVIKNNIDTNLKYNGNTLFVTVPDLSQIFDGNSPTTGVVAIQNEELNNVADIFASNIKNKINKIDIYKVLLSSMASSGNDNVNMALKEFITSTNFVEKNGEDINGISTYHYEINASKPATKKFLSTISGVFTLNLSDENKTNLDNVFGSASLDSFEVWIGKNDDNIYKYKFTLSIPLSKIIGLDDKGIANNQVKLDWQTTYYDINIANDIKIPESATDMADFIKNVHDIEIKNIISSFSSAARSLFNAVGNYGNHSNLTGNCVNPALGSLFSPLGYSKKASTQVGNIASIMNNLLSKTGNTGSCYSTSRAWALASTLSDSKTFCVDSTGASKTLDNKLTGTVCK